MLDFIVREATDEDGPALSALVTDVLAGYPGCALDGAEEPSLERPASRFSERGGRLWVVTRDGAVAGSLGLFSDTRPGEFELACVCLDPSSRGQGLATALLAGADAFAAASGGERLSHWIDTRLTDGMRFLERHGFMREPGLKGRQDGSDALESRFSRAVALEVSSPPSEARPAGDV